MYGVIKNKCIQDDKYCWYLNKDAPATDKDKKNPIPQTALSNICRYYLACLGQDDGGEISVFADSKFVETPTQYSLDYVELDSLPNSDNGCLFDTDNVRNLFGKIRKDRGRMEMYFGYPTTLKKVRSKKSNWEGLFVEPILLFPVEVHNGTPEVSQVFPIFNLSVLKRFTNAEREQLMEELVQIEEELGLNSEDELPELDDLVKKLNKIRPEWPWQEPINSDELLITPALRHLQEEGIYNRAVLIIGERSLFTRGLESELKSLSDIQRDGYENTALG